MKITTAIATCFVFAMLFVGCKDCAPLPNPGSNLVVSFHDSTDTKVDMAFFSVRGLGNDSVLYPNATDSVFSTFQLPLNLRTPTTIFVFEQRDTAGVSTFDSLMVSYEVNAVINKPDCDLFETVFNLQIAASSFDSIVLNSSLIEKSESSNIKVFIN